MDAPSSASSEGNKDDLGEYVRSFPDPGLLHILSQETEFSNENGSLPNTEFRPGMHAINALRNAKVLVVGAGGLGCEVLVSLAISGFQYIVVIDYDRIELSNLNRQFLFREEHIGLCKSEVASNAIRTKFPKVECVPCTSRVQELPSTFFKDFTVVIGALDNLEARRELSAILVRNVSVCIPLLEHFMSIHPPLSLPHISSLFRRYHRFDHVPTLHSRQKSTYPPSFRT